MNSKFMVDSGNLRELIEEKDDGSIVILDVSTEKTVGMPAFQYDRQHVIPGSFKVHFESILSNNNSDFDNEKPDTSAVSNFINRFQLHTKAQVILYDREGIYSSPRAWLVLKSLDLHNVRVLNGGLRNWVLDANPTVDSFAKYVRFESSHKKFECSEARQVFCDKEFIIENIRSREYSLVDVRSQARFKGNEPESRVGVRSGHIPGAINIPFTEFLSNRAFLDPKTIAKVFASRGLNPEDKIIFTCGSGLTACVGYFAAVMAGYNAKFVYDGSWQEWGSDHELAVEKR